MSGSRLLGRFSSMWPVRIQVTAPPPVYTGKRPDLRERLRYAFDAARDRTLPCTHLPRHLLRADDSWPAELRWYPVRMLRDKRGIADLLRKTYPDDKRLVEFAQWLHEVDKTHPKHDLELRYLAITPAFVVSMSAVSFALVLALKMM